MSSLQCRMLGVQSKYIVMHAYNNKFAKFYGYTIAVPDYNVCSRVQDSNCQEHVSHVHPTLIVHSMCVDMWQYYLPTQQKITVLFIGVETTIRDVPRI